MKGNLMNTYTLPASVKNLAAELETLHVQLESMAEIVREALDWVWSLERQITAIFEELHRQEFHEIDSLQEMGCDPEAIEAARGLVTVEPNYDTDDDGMTIDIVTVDGRRFRRAHELDPDMPMRWSERRENEQIWQLWAASIGGEIIKG